MKKISTVLGLAASLLFLASCAPDQPKDSASSSSSTSTNASTTETSAEVASGASAKTYSDPSTMEDQYDIIIVGSGGAGMSAAIEAKDAGLNPVIFEKMPVIGGNTNKASSGMNASETKFQAAEGITDSNQAFFDETLAGGHGTNDQEMLHYFVDNSADAIDWLDSLGIRLNNLTITGGMSTKRTHRPEDGSAVGEYLVTGLSKNVQEREIPIFVNSDVLGLIEKDDQVTGIEVSVEGQDAKKINGSAVIVATGGYGANSEMIESVRSDLKGVVTTNQEGSTGDGIKMIEAVGGYTVDMDQIQVHPTVQQDKGVLIGEAVRGEGAILVDATGKRFVNELDTRDNVTAAINNLPEKSATLIFDQGVKDRATAIEFYQEQGYVVEGTTIEELAEKMEMPAANLTATLSTWDQAVKNQDDAEFGRTTAMENDLSHGPFYAITIAPGIHYTMGGVKINTKTEVLKTDGSSIPALYAAGEVTGGLHGENRIGGNSVAEIIIFGRQAGVQAAEYVKNLK
ncbi:flavocytochrome c [Enterococcus timonensis]|uniref:flavocytochrome c n=1 Tax=Enterococcus timonensis TaxID=1852364 RepID=UPI000A5E2ABE|nr:flavocytochrome c [Enterococcus timonensis]